MPPRDPRPFHERFWSHVKKQDGDGCWEWEDARTEHGYGMFKNRPHRHEAASFRAHRISWELEHGVPPPETMDVCHRCDNPPCVRPSHLFLGTATDNSVDMVTKGRGTNKLSEEQAREIIASDEDTGTLAHRFGVTQDAIRDLCSKRTWPHLRELPRMAKPILKASGEENGWSKLNWTAVREIRSSTASPQELGAKFGVTPDAVRNVRNGKTWREETLQ